MTMKEVIAQLESLKYHCGSMISDPDDEWVKDVETLNMAMEIVRKQV